MFTYLDNFPFLQILGVVHALCRHLESHETIETVVEHIVRSVFLQLKCRYAKNKRHKKYIK